MSSLDAFLYFKVKVIWNSSIYLSDYLFKLLDFNEEKVDSQEWDKVIAKPLKEDCVRLINWLLSYIVTALVVYPKWPFKHRNYSLVHLCSQRNMAQLRHSLQKNLLKLHLNHQLPYFIENRLQYRISIVVRYSKSYHFYLWAQHVIRISALVENLGWLNVVETVALVVD